MLDEALVRLEAGRLMCTAKAAAKVNFNPTDLSSQ